MAQPELEMVFGMSLEKSIGKISSYVLIRLHKQHHEGFKCLWSCPILGIEDQSVYLERVPQAAILETRHFLCLFDFC